ncbi:MAG: DoxX family membrane protein, partial [Anaerolineales bacterium]|nr:DoxX family membrane protein [Anaerolineales bacterium]
MLNLHPYFLLCLRILLATIFLYYGLSKLKSLNSFIAAVMSYRLIPAALAQPFALTLVAIEIVLGVLLLFGWYTRIAAAVGGV